MSKGSEEEHGSSLRSDQDEEDSVEGMDAITSPIKDESFELFGDNELSIIDIELLMFFNTSGLFDIKALSYAARKHRLPMPCVMIVNSLLS